MGNRIKELREAGGLSQEELAERLSTTKQTVSRHEREERRLNDVWMRRYAEALSVKPADLLTGSGGGGTVVARSARAVHVTPGDVVELYTPGLGVEEYACLGVYDIPVAAGQGKIHDVLHEDLPVPISTRLVPLAWIQGISGAGLEHLALVHVSGASMEPTLRTGDQVLVDTSQRSCTQDGLYAIEYGGAGAQIKRLTRSPKTNLLSVSSDNTAHPSWHDVGDEEVDIIGRVVWMGRQV